MNREEIFEELNSIFRDLFDDLELTVNDDTTAQDVDGWDSLMHITLISAVESKFGIRFAMKDVIGMENVGEMVDIIEENI